MIDEIFLKLIERFNFFEPSAASSFGISDFSRYAPSGRDAGPLQGDFFVPDAVFDRSPTRIKRGF